jgi:hypothetical protein
VALAGSENGKEGEESGAMFVAAGFSLRMGSADRDRRRELCEIPDDRDGGLVRFPATATATFLSPSVCWLC